jgi:hypothetical protein
MDSELSGIFDSKSASVLLIDDQPANLKPFSRMLKSHGFQNGSAPPTLVLVNFARLRDT